MADAIVSVVLEQLISIIGKETNQQVRLVVGVRKEIEKLTSNFRAIQAVLLDAERRGLKDTSARDWLDKLKNASYDMDDVLDEWNTAILKLQSERAESALVHTKKDFERALKNAGVIWGAEIEKPCSSRSICQYTEKCCYRKI